MIVSGEITITHYVSTEGKSGKAPNSVSDPLNSATRINQPFRPLKLHQARLQTKMSQYNSAASLAPKFETKHRLAENTRTMQKLGVQQIEDLISFKLINLQRHQFAGLNELFLPHQFPTRRYGAQVNSQSLVYLRFGLGTRIKRHMKTLFKSLIFKDLQRHLN